MVYLSMYVIMEGAQIARIMLAPEPDESIVPLFAFYAAIMFSVLFFLGVYMYSLDRNIRRFVPILRGVAISRWGVYILSVGIVLHLGYTLFFMSPVTTAEMLLLLLLIAVMVLVGQGLIAVGMWRLGVHYGSSDIKLSAILLFLIPLVGFPMLCYALDSLEDRVSRRIPLPPPPPWLSGDV